jgi:hypothetical protein
VKNLVGKCLVMSNEAEAKDYAEKIVACKMTQYCDYIYVEASSILDDEEILVRYNIEEAAVVRETISVASLKIIMSSDARIAETMHGIFSLIFFYRLLL